MIKNSNNNSIKEISNHSIDLKLQELYSQYLPYKIIYIEKNKGSDIGLELSISRNPFRLKINNINDIRYKKIMSKDNKILFINDLQLDDFTMTEINQLILNKTQLTLLIC